MGHSNSGLCRMDSTKDMGAIMKMWLNAGGVAIIIPLKILEKILPITYDSRHHGGKLVLHTDQGNIIVKNNNKGMPYLDLQKLEAKVALTFIQSVCGNIEGYTKRVVEEACSACKARAMLSQPTDQEFLGMVCSGMILNCPVTLAAMQNANHILGPNLAGVRGQTMRKPPESVTMNHVKFPRALLERYQWVTLAIGVTFVNGVP